MADDSNIRLSIEGKNYDLDPDDLELGEVEIIEDLMGAAISEVDFTRAKAVTALVYILKRREDPKFTLDMARRVKLSAIGEQQEPARPTKKAA